MKRLLALLALSLFFLPAAASAQQEFEDQVLGYLSDASSVITAEGYDQTPDKTVGSLTNGTSDRHGVAGMGGLDYVFVAVCDQDCSDIDLHLYDENDNLIAQDVEDDDFPLIEVSMLPQGHYTLEISMHACAAEPCYYAIGTYVREGTEGGGMAGGDAYVEQVVILLDNVSGIAIDNGFTPTGEEWIDALPAGESAEFDVNLGGGADYLFVGVCDVDCDDIDMGVYSGGNLIQEDVEADATPVLELNGVRGGVHTVQVRMYQCSNEPCYWGVRLYKRTGQAPMPPVETPELRRP